MGIQDLPALVNDTKATGESLNYYIPIAELTGKRVWVDVNAVFFSNWNAISRDHCNSSKRLMEDGVDYQYIVSRWKSSVLRTVHDWMGMKVDITLVLDGEAPASKTTTRMNRRNERDKYREKASNAARQMCELVGIPYKQETYKTGTLPPIPLDKIHVAEKLRDEHRDALKCYIDPIRENWIDLMDTLRSEGIRCIQSNVEAETLCCKAVLDGRADYVLSSDSDCLAYRVPIWLRDWDPYTRAFRAVSLKSIIQRINIPESRFLDYCIMCGCDYNERINCNKAGKTIRMGPVTAAKLLRERSLDQIIEQDTTIDWSVLNVEFARGIFNLEIDVHEVSLAQSSDVIEV